MADKDVTSHAEEAALTEDGLCPSGALKCRGISDHSAEEICYTSSLLTRLLPEKKKTGRCPGAREGPGRRSMRKQFACLGLICALALAAPVVAEESETVDVLDNTAELKQVEENGIPTSEMVRELKENADALYEAQDYEKAAEAYDETARKANYLANIMSQCIEPYYSSRNESKTIPDEILDDMLVFESTSNELKGIRDLCYVYQGICYNRSGDSEMALAILYRALDLITDKEEDAWTLAAKEIMGIIQYTSDEETVLKQEVRSYEGKPYADFVERFGEAGDKSEYSSINKTTYEYDDYWVSTKKEGGEEIIESIIIW